MRPTRPLLIPIQKQYVRKQKNKGKIPMKKNLVVFAHFPHLSTRYNIVADKILICDQPMSVPISCWRCRMLGQFLMKSRKVILKDIFWLKNRLEKYMLDKSGRYLFEHQINLDTSFFISRINPRYHFIRFFIPISKIISNFCLLC